MPLSRLKEWGKTTVNGRILSAAVTVGWASLVVRSAEAFTYLFVAYRFGTGDDVEAFIIAFLVPTFIINILGSSFSASIIPAFVEVRETAGLEAAQRLLSGVLFLAGTLAAALWAMLAITGHWIIPLVGSGFSSEKLVLTRSLFYLLLPALFLTGTTRVWASILNAQEKFAVAALSPMARPLVVIFFLAAFADPMGIYSLAIGIVAGSALEAVFLARGITGSGFSPMPRLFVMDRPTRKVLGQFVPMVAGAFLFGGTELIDQAMAAMLDPGAVSALSYGHKVVMFILVVAAGALGTAVFPHFSRMVALLEWNAIAHTLRTYAVLILVASIPITLLCYVYSEQLVRIIYERGAFLNADTRRVAAVQAMYCLQTGFYLVNILLVRLISAMKGNRILMFSAFISLPLNVVLNYILMWRMREAGIALSTSIVSAASLVFLSAMACRMLKNARRGG